MTRLSGVNRVLPILRDAEGISARGVWNLLMAQGHHMAMQSISPVLSNLVASGDARISNHEPCAHCGTQRARYELTYKGKHRINTVVNKEEA